MKKTIQVELKQEALTLMTNVTFARVPSWYGFTTEDLKMDIIVPKHRQDHKLLPAVLWFCGGAFCVVDKSVWMPQMMELARRGYVVASAEYRTSNAVSFPEPLKDVKAAIRFLRKNAAEFCIDPNRIAVMGESAGGTMACLAGVTGDLPQFENGINGGVSSKVQAVVDFYGLTDLRFMPEHNEDENVSDWAMTAFLGQYTPENAAAASAITYITQDAPPVLILHGANDITVPIAGSESYYAALTSAGVYTDFYTIDGAIHGDDLFYQKEIMDLIDAFLRKVM